MRYTFAATVVVEPIRLEREDREREAERSLSFSHVNAPFREMGDCMLIRAEVDSPRGTSPEQQTRFERAMNRTLNHFRYYIAEEFSRLNEDTDQ